MTTTMGTFSIIYSLLLLIFAPVTALAFNFTPLSKVAAKEATKVAIKTSAKTAGANAVKEAGYASKSNIGLKTGARTLLVYSRSDEDRKRQLNKQLLGFPYDK